MHKQQEVAGGSDELMQIKVPAQCPQIARALENREVERKKKSRSSDSASGYTPKGTKNRDSNRYLYATGHCNIIYNHRQVATTQSH